MTRPRTFDTEQALDEAMLVFWRLGYDRASLGDLTKAMGINRPSLYAAFGNKETLFRKALDHYARGHGGLRPRRARAADRSRGRRSAATRRRRRPDTTGHAARLPRDPRRPHAGEASSPIAATLIEARRAGEAELCDRFERALAEGDLPDDVDPDELAGFVRTVAYGMAVKAATGATRAELDRVVDHAMRAWPDSR